ncbi:MAG TPA: LD-carboxypeptidase [Paenalcaligenes sp.]|nr:LD-carboxypeptidase [Paenalcaligenes sp.]
MSIKTKTNDGIYIISPSSAIGSPQALSRAQQRLEELGFEPSVDPDACAVYERFAGTDAQRLSAFERALQQPAPFVLASRGGYGMSRLLPFINWQAIAQSGKQFIGHSDFTAFNLALYAQTQTISYAGPCAVFDFGQETVNQEMADWFVTMLRGEQTKLHFHAQSIRPQRSSLDVAGVFWGGNLALLCSLVGTPYLPDVEGGILFLEDVSEHPYRIERMLSQLHLAGILKKQRAILLGDFTDYRLVPADRGYRLQSVWQWLARHVQVPIYLGFPYGHVPRKATLPIGAGVRLLVKDQQATLFF